MGKQRDEKGRFLKGNKIGKTFQKGDVGNPAGRPPAMHNVLRKLPADAREKVYDALWTAVSLPDIKSAAAYLYKAAEDMPECGIVLQLAAKTLAGDRGWFALMDICDRLFGKPRQIAEIEGNFNLTPPPVIIEGEDD